MSTHASPQAILPTFEPPNIGLRSGTASQRLVVGWVSARSERRMDERVHREWSMTYIERCQFEVHKHQEGMVHRHGFFASYCRLKSPHQPSHPRSSLHFSTLPRDLPEYRHMPSSFPSLMLSILRLVLWFSATQLTSNFLRSGRLWSKATSERRLEGRRYKDPNQILQIWW